MPRKAIDLTGQKFDKLTVLKQAPSQSNHAYWECICDCGNTCIKSSKSLRTSKKLDCGCRQAQRKQELALLPPIPPRKKDITGQRFGKLVALTPTEERIRGSVVWKCRCDCGNIKLVPLTYLTSGGTQSCGCLIREAHYKDLTGQRFGKLVALYIAPTKSRSCLEWICKCDCGNTCQVESYHLTSGGVRSCGCINSSVGESNIEAILQKNNILYKKEYTNSKELGRLRFDFALLNKNDEPTRFIEFDGEQHFTDKKGIWNSTDTLADIQTRDQEKNNYALTHNIPLVRIPYWERDNITLDIIFGDKYLVKQGD